MKNSHFSLFVFIWIVGMLLSPIKTFSQETQPLDLQAKQAMLALNYCHMSLVRILAYQDRIILDEEYNNIINNINLSAIKDEEILTVLKSLMDALTEFKLTDGDKRMLTQEYDRQVAKAFHLAFKSDMVNMITGMTMNAITEKINAGPMLRSLLAVGGQYEHYRNNLDEYRDQLDKKLWRLEKDTIAEINDLRKSFLEVYWRLMTKYNIPDEWRLSEQQLQRVVDVFEEHDAEKRLRQLEEMQQNFVMFPPFWYAVAKTAHELGQDAKAFDTYQKIQRERIAFFREDHAYSSALMDKIVLVDELENSQSDLKVITQNSPYDGRKNLFAAIKYTDTSCVTSNR